MDAIDEAPDDPPTSSRWGRLWPVVLGVGIAIAATAVVLVATRGDDGPSFPDEWDARVVPYIEFVEEERGLEFLHPVEVRFLDDDDFEAEVTADEADLTDEDRAAIDETTEVFRAFGLVEGELDLFDATNELTGEGTLGFYRFDDRTITMRGAELTPFSELTLVHELTHVLQDQHFEIGDQFEAIDPDDTVSGAVLTAIVEGDARRVETAYRSTLTAEAEAAVAAEEEAAFAEFEAGVEEVPAVLQTFFATPYVFGEAMLAVVEAQDGTEGIDELFRDPPTSEEPLLDPWVPADGAEPLDVPEPDLGDGETEIGRGQVGSPGWLLLLAERIDVGQALDAADGWGGDAYVAFRRDDVVCVRVDWRGDSEADASEMTQALDDWVDAGPPGSASLERRDDGLRLESCDPGSAVEGITLDASEAALTLAASRTYAALGFFETGATADEARCVGDGIIDVFDTDELADPDFVPDDDQQREIFAIVGECL